MVSSEHALEALLRDHASPARLPRPVPTLESGSAALLSSSANLDGSGCGLLSSGDREAEHALAQARLDPVRVKVTGERELALKVAHLVLLVDRTVTGRRVLLHLSPDT